MKVRQIEVRIYHPIRNITMHKKLTWAESDRLAGTRLSAQPIQR